MRKVTEEAIKDYVEENGEFEKEHRKYSSFYCWVNHTIKQEDVEYIAEHYGADASGFLNVNVSMSGMWDESCGTEWDNIEYSKVEEYQELVPEVVIPEHYVTKHKSHPFVPEWE